MKEFKEIMAHYGEHFNDDSDDMDDEAWEQRWREGQARYDAELVQWLSQYDDSGNLKPGIFGTRGYISNNAHSFATMSDDERAAFIVSEKKRMGML